MRPVKAATIAYPPSARVAAAVLLTISRGSLLVLLLLLTLAEETRLTNQLRLLRAFVGFCLAPEAAAWLLRRAFAVQTGVEGELFVLRGRRHRIEIPCASIVRIASWTVPLPAGGVWLFLRSGRRFERGLQVADPIALAATLAEAGAPLDVRAVAEDRLALYTRARQSAVARWYHTLLKFPLLALLPTLPLFRLHQWIAYGSTFGEYYMFGLKAYLLAFGIYWVTYTIYLVLYAAGLRAVAEAVVLPATLAAPAQAATVRRAVEVGRRILYYGAVPAFLVRLYLASR